MTLANRVMKTHRINSAKQCPASGTYRPQASQRWNRDTAARAKEADQDFVTRVFGKVFGQESLTEEEPMVCLPERRVLCRFWLGTLNNVLALSHSLQPVSLVNCKNFVAQIMINATESRLGDAEL